jgi:hypothetical protein
VDRRESPASIYGSESLSSPRYPSNCARQAAQPYALPVRRTKVHLSQPRAAQPFQPEPPLDDAIYEAPQQ